MKKFNLAGKLILAFSLFCIIVVLMIICLHYMHNVPVQYHQNYPCGSDDV